MSVNIKERIIESIMGISSMSRALMIYVLALRFIIIAFSDTVDVQVLVCVKTTLLISFHLKSKKDTIVRIMDISFDSPHERKDTIDQN